MHMRTRTHAHTFTHTYIYIYVCIHLVYATARWHVMFCLLFNSLQLIFDLIDFESQKIAWLHSWVLTCFSSDCGPYPDSLTIGASGRALDWAAHDSHTFKIVIKQHNWNKRPRSSLARVSLSSWGLEGFSLCTFPNRQILTSERFLGCPVFGHANGMSFK